MLTFYCLISKTITMVAVYNRIDLFKDFVQQHLGEPMPTADEIAYEIHVSRSTLFRMVEKELGMSPFQYIRQAKLEQAKILLENGDCENIRQLAYAVGYSRTDYFASIFERAFGIDLKEVFR